MADQASCALPGSLSPFPLGGASHDGSGGINQQTESETTEQQLEININIHISSNAAAAIAAAAATQQRCHDSARRGNGVVRAGGEARGQPTSPGTRHQQKEQERRRRRGGTRATSPSATHQCHSPAGEETQEGRHAGNARGSHTSVTHQQKGYGGRTANDAEQTSVHGPCTLVEQAA